MDNSEILDSLRVTSTTRRPVGGTWVEGSIAGHTFSALVFEEHAACADYELGDSRISKLSLRQEPTNSMVACFDRGWDQRPGTERASAIVDVLAAGLAETVFGR